MQEAISGQHHEAEGTTGLDNRKLLMWAFLGSECFFFGSLIATNLVYAGKSLSGPGVEIFTVPVTAVATFVLMSSSLMMVLALAALRNGNLRGFRVWIVATIVLGATFLGFQFFEFYSFVHEGLTPRTNLFGSTFFTLTGFHGAHVTVGLIWLTSLLALSFWKGGAPLRDGMKAEVAGLYWHFVDVVWVVIFTVIYLTQYAVHY